MNSLEILIIFESRIRLLPIQINQLVQQQWHPYSVPDLQPPLVNLIKPV